MLLQNEARLFCFMYAIVDIETTGGSAGNEKITEIAIITHDGKKIVDRYSTLLNPEKPIPEFIQRFTGITDYMVQNQPKFYEVAKDILELMEGKIFVAHNVNFDYSFVKYHLETAGYNLQAPKVCTIRTSRKVFPGLKKYGLGYLTRELGIKIEGRHRAGGDALATAQIMQLILQKNGLPIIKDMLKKEALLKEQNGE